MDTEAIRRLERRPAAVSFSIEDLLTYLASGRIRLPRFQRGLRWEDDDRVKLLDSIYRGFPIGTLLFWKRPADAETLHLGNISISADARTDALWVVDGQQRLNALAEALLATPESERTRSLRFDLDEQIFAFGMNNTKGPPRWLPLSQVIDSARLLDWADRHGLRQSGHLTSALDMSKRVREYQIPAYIVESESESTLRQIFDRSNSTGKALEAAEVFDALHGSLVTEEPSSLRGIAESLVDTGFGRIDEKYVLRALLAVRRKDPGRGFRQLAAGEAPAALADTARSLRQAVIFVKREAGFPHYALLPYKLPLATLSLFFHEHPTPSPRTRTLLTRWLWRGAISGSHSGDTVALRSTLAAIVPSDETRSVQGLLSGVERRAGAALPLRPFDFRHARSKLHVVALAALQPMDVENGGILDTASLCEQAGGPVVRVSRRQLREPAASGLASRFLHRHTSGSRLKTLLSRCTDQRVLDSHAVSNETQAMLRHGDLEEFLRRRERDLAEHVDGYLDRKAEWSAADRDRPALEALVVSD